MKARMPWFRMHAEFVDDPKVQRLDGDLFKFWVNCLGLACQNSGLLPSVSDISWKTKLPEKRVTSFLAELHEATLLDQENEAFIPHNWSARQYKSDVSTERVRRFRNGDETFHETGKKRRETVSETPPDTDTDTDTEKPTSADAEFEQVLDEVSQNIHGRHPRRKCSLAMVKQKLRTISKLAPKAERIAKLRRVNATHEAMCSSFDWTKDSGRWVKSLKAWLNPSEGLYDEMPPEQQGLFAPECVRPSSAPRLPLI